MISKSLHLLIFLSLIIFSYEQQCVLGQNCPYNQGVCVLNSCQCNKGYETLLDESLPPDQQIYCNYEKFSQYVPILLELFLPSIGHFVVGKYWMGIIKLTLLLTFLGSTYYLEQKLRFPDLFNVLFEAIGIHAFIDFKKEDEGNENNDNNENEDEEDGGTRLRSKRKPSKPNYVVSKQFHEEGDEVPENQEPLLPKENENKEDYKEKFLKFLSELSGAFISLLYFLDLFLYKLGVYKDGNGISFD